jgi:glycosyltransferase involved in cell wall biosynthesis
MTGRAQLSAVIITLDAARSLESCLASLHFVDEILIVDAGSKDATEDIAGSFKCRFLSNDWQGFGRQKRFAVDQASHDWVLCIDADERVSDALAKAILTTLVAPVAGAYEMPRSNYFLGRYLKHGEGYPDWSLRLFDRRVANWSSDAVHEKVVSTAAVARLSTGDLLHHSADDLSSYLEKQNRYTSLQADQLYRMGVEVGVTRMLLAPALRFVKFYVLRGGFLDGTAGLIHIMIGCFNSLMKYAKLIALHKAAAR